MYSLRSGWGASYPETTGYIIPTLLNYANFTGKEEFTQRAIRMARWESKVQMREGAVMGGTVDNPPTPAIFNTGQVIFGWCAAHSQTDDHRFLDSAWRAGDFLCKQQDEDGLWRRHLSRFCSAPTDTYAYNVRTAWALLLLAESTGEKRFSEVAERNVSAVAQLALPNGWVDKNCLTDASCPLLHTIAYTLQGLLECAVRLDDDRAMKIVIAGSHHLRRDLEQKGKLSGRYDRHWSPSVQWRCLTGEAQMAIVWYRLAQFTGDAIWRATADDLVEGVCRTQKLTGSSTVVGGVKGAYPVWGDYGSYEYLNWAAKFHADALMLKLGVGGAGGNG
jgi:hypothetical protein